MFDTEYVRERVRELEFRCDYRGIHALMRGWPWPSDERPDSEAAFAKVEQRIATHEFVTLAGRTRKQ